VIGVEVCAIADSLEFSKVVPGGAARSIRTHTVRGSGICCGLRGSESVPARKPHIAGIEWANVHRVGHGADSQLAGLSRSALSASDWILAANGPERYRRKISVAEKGLN